MKKWNNPEIVALDLSSTEHQVRLSFQLDGGYLGDGQVSGWFGPDPKPETKPSSSVPASTLTPATRIVTDLNS